MAWNLFKAFVPSVICRRHSTFKAVPRFEGGRLGVHGRSLGIADPPFLTYTSPGSLGRFIASIPSRQQTFVTTNERHPLPVLCSFAKSRGLWDLHWAV